LTALTATYATGGNSYSWTDVNGGTQQVATTNTNTTLSSSFGCSGVTELSGTRYLPTNVSYPDGTHLGVSYTAQGRLHVLTLPKGGTITYSYLGGNSGINCTYQVSPTLTRVTSDGTTTYTWAAANNGNGWGNTTTVVDNGGNKTVYTFTGLTSTGNALYPAVQALTQVQHYQGSSTLLTTDVYCYNAKSGQPGNCSTAVVSLPITEIDVYHTINGMTTSSRTQTNYDKYGNVTLSAQYDFGGTTPTVQTTTTYGTWNGSTCVSVASTINNKPCDVLTTQSGSNIAESRFAYDSTGGLLTTYRWNGTVWLSNSTVNSYNGNGTVATSYDLANNPTSYAYNGTGGCNSAFPTSVTSGGLTTYKTWNCIGGVLVTNSIPNNSSAVTTYGYANSSGTADPYWRVSSVTDPLGITTYTNYTPTSTSNVFNFGSSINNTTITSDSYGRPINRQTQQAPSSSQYDTVSSSYGWSTNYRSTFTSLPCSTTLGATCSIGAATLLDPLGRPYTTTDAGGGTVTTTYSQNDVVSTLSPAPSGEHAKVTQKQYDGLGRLQRICAIESSGGTACGQNTGTSSGVVTGYSYTAATGRSTTTATRGSQTRGKTLDALGRVTSISNPESGTTNLYYDVQAACSGSVAGHLTRTVDANGNSICYFYDALGRVTTANANGTTCRKFYYDNSNGFSGTIPTGVTITNPYGHMVEAATSNCSTTLITDEWFSYDKDGRMTDMWEMTPHSGMYYHSTATFFLNGAINTLHLADPSLYTDTYGIDGEGRLSSLSTSTTTTPMVSAAKFNAASQTTEIDLGSGTDRDLYTYDPNTGRMTNWEFDVSTQKETAALTWNANGTLRELSITDGFNSGGTQDCKFGTPSVMGYDDLGRLLSDTCGTVWAQTFSYDDYNNLTKSGSITWNPGYSSSTNRYTLAGTSYDSNGNLLNDTMHTYTWNEFSKLKTVDSTTCGTNGECVTYDALGRVVESSKNASYTEIWYTQLGKTAYMNGSAINYAYWPTPGGGTLLDNGNGVSLYYQHKDWLGSARISSTIINHTIIDDRAFAPYGELYNNFGSTAQSGNIFTGDTQDIVSGTWDTPNRELNPSQGRWISPDPSGAGWNLYAYAPNPNSSVDTSGLHGIGVTNQFLFIDPFGGPMDRADIMFVINGYPVATGTVDAGGAPSSDSPSSSSGSSPMPTFCGCPDDLTSGVMAGSQVTPPSDLLGTDPSPVFLTGCGGPGIPCTIVLQQLQPLPRIEYAEDGSVISAYRPYNYLIEDINGEAVYFAHSTEWNEALSDGSHVFFQGTTSHQNPFSDIVGFASDGPPVEAFVTAQRVSVQVGDGGPDYLLPGVTILHGAAKGGGMFSSFATVNYGDP
jgi:RHS repeat-associated protein